MKIRVVRKSAARKGVWVRVPSPAPHGDVAESANAAELGSAGEILGGASPLVATNLPRSSNG